MPVAIDTSALIAAEKMGGVESVLPANEDGPFYIPAMAAAEFLVGTHPPVRDDLRYRALLLYQAEYQSIVDDFTAFDAGEMARLIAELRRKGQTMKFFDAGIAATVLARGDKLLTADNDFDRIGDRIALIKL